MFESLFWGLLTKLTSCLMPLFTISFVLNLLRGFLTDMWGGK